MSKLDKMLQRSALGLVREAREAAEVLMASPRIGPAFRDFMQRDTWPTVSIGQAMGRLVGISECRGVPAEAALARATANTVTAASDLCSWTREEWRESVRDAGQPACAVAMLDRIESILVRGCWIPGQNVSTDLQHALQAVRAIVGKHNNRKGQGR